MPQSAADVIRSADLRARYPVAARTSDGAGPPARGFSLFGDGAAATADTSPIGAAAPEGATEDKDGFTLNFDNTPVATVAKAVLGDILGVGYVVDPRAQGAISLSTGRPIAKKDVLFVLESALRANNLVLVREGSIYHIAMNGEGGVGPTDGDGARPGYGLTVVPLRYVSGSTLARLLEGFATKPGTVRTDPSGRVLIVIGSGVERQAALETIKSFDVDWLRGQSVGMYPVRNSEPEPVVAELEKIMDSGESGMGHGLVKLQAVARQNAILVVTAKPEMLRAAARWIERLDSPSAANESVHVYKVRYGEAKQVAQTLNALFTGAGGGAGTESATNQLAPSSGSTSLTTTQRLTGGAPPAAASTPTPAASSDGQSSSSSPFGSLASQALGNAFSGSGQSGAGGSNSLLPNLRITPDAANNTLVIYANAQTYKIVERALAQIDRPRTQVAIDVTIAEVTLNDQLNYGVQVYLSTHVGSLVNSTTGQTLSNADAPAGFNVFAGSNMTPRAIINALHQLTDVKILSNPSLVVVDNQKATLEVGDQVPISTGSATVLSANNAVVNTINYQNTGIILNVLPRVSPDNSVLLDIEQEISSVPPGTSTSNSTNLTPTISQRKVTSEISVVSGQMVMLAGLVSDTQTTTRSGVPVLDQLPVVGGAFGSSAKTTARTELIILIRPQIIRDGADASMVAEQLRAKLRAGRIDAVTLPAALQLGARPIQ